MDKQNGSWLEINVSVDSELAEAVAEVLSRYAENGVVVILALALFAAIFTGVNGIYR